MRLPKLLLCLPFVLIAASPLPAQTKQAKQGKTDWNAPFPPHKVIGNVYFVGSAELASFLITTPQGDILINSDFEATVPVIRASVEKLGFKFTDIKIILGSHAHGDHMEGDALAKELSGARVMAMEQDVPLLRKMTPGNKPHPIDKILKDGEQVTLGGTTLTAHLTAGHTPGCTTWTTKAEENGKSYNVLIVCSVGINPGYVLVNNKDYPSIADDYARSFKVLRTLPVDVFLGAHGSFYGLQAKYAKLKEGGANPFIDPAGFQAYLDDKEKAFRTELAAQTSKQ
jgi:metallo-beta-lactamase class B